MAEEEEEQQPSQISLLLARIGSILKQLPGAALLFAIVPLVLVGYLGWYYFAADKIDDIYYGLKQKNLQVTAQPEWITKANVSEEVFTTQDLSKVSLLDSAASSTIAQAFESHSWVKSVSRVAKSADRKVLVDLIYRKPVAMVYYHPSDTAPHAPSEHNQATAGCYPVDDETVVLSTKEFSTEELYDFIIIDAVDARPADLGLPFGDPRITEAVKLSMFLEKERNALGLRWIRVDQDTRSVAPSPWVMTLYTYDSHVLHWGHAPLLEGNGEPDAQEKMRRMRTWLKVARESTTAQVIDLRTNRVSARPKGDPNPTLMR